MITSSGKTIVTSHRTAAASAVSSRLMSPPFTTTTFPPLKRLQPVRKIQSVPAIGCTNPSRPTLGNISCRTTYAPVANTNDVSATTLLPHSTPHTFPAELTPIMRNPSSVAKTVLIVPFLRLPLPAATHIKYGTPGAAPCHSQAQILTESAAHMVALAHLRPVRPRPFPRLERQAPAQRTSPRSPRPGPRT
jgi:hypothetical protein